MVIKKIKLYKKEYYIKGKFKKNLIRSRTNRIVSIVGTRSCTPQGYNDAKNLASILASFGVTIISGGARGIDTASHNGALIAGGKTGAVLGNGLDIVYPAENKKLFDSIAKNGFLLSEFEHDQKPTRWSFPKRNETIAQLCDLLVVIEATEKGGSRITAEYALNMGKSIFALPGNRRSSASVGCNQLIYDGAHILIDPSDILDFLGISHRHKGWNFNETNVENIAGENIDGETFAPELKIFEKLPADGFTLFEASHTLNKTVAETSTLLLRLTKLHLLTSNRGLWFKL